MSYIFTHSDLVNFFKEKKYKTIIVADAETVIHVEENGQMIEKTSPGGVSVALEPIVKAALGTYIGRAKSINEKKVGDKHGKIKITSGQDSYTLKRLFIPEDEEDLYYNGFSNQTLWPLCHVAFQQPQFNKIWYQGYEKVNKRFAASIKEELKGKTFLWINDYQLALVPKYLERPKETMIGMFWHIPWPTWEIFRILPEKKELLESLLSCDFIGFHRNYHVENFLETVERELEVRIERETKKIHYKNHVTTVKNLPMGIDTDVISSMYQPEQKKSLLPAILKNMLGYNTEKTGLESYFEHHRVVLGIDRLDYTKGLPERLHAIDTFFHEYPQYKGKLIYLSILAPSREKIPSYQKLKEHVMELGEEINNKYRKNNWKPIQFIFNKFPRNDLINFYSKADVCLITPLDDGMNLVSKEFVISSSFSSDPGMLVLSRFAGSATDLSSSVIVNPYDPDEVARAIKTALEMPKKEKVERMKTMVDTMEERNIYEWGKDFARMTETGAKDNGI